MNYEAFIIGILIAVLYVELTGIYPGGIVVPAFLSFYLDQPLRYLATVAVAYLAYCSFRALSRHLLLFGKRRFVFLLLLGALYVQISTWMFPGFLTPSLDLRAVGWIIPGLLANNLERQKHLPTLAGLLTVSIMTYFLLILVRAVFP